MTMEDKFKVLIALDGSDQAMTAAECIADIVAPENLEVVLVHVMRMMPKSYWDLDPDSQTEEQDRLFASWHNDEKSYAGEMIARAEQILLDQGVQRESIKTIIKDRRTGVARDILNEAKSGFDAVVVGKGETGRIKELMLGNVAKKLLSNIGDIPICVVTEKPDPCKILVAVDSRDYAKKIIRFIPRLINKNINEIAFVHAVRMLSQSVGPQDAAGLEEGEEIILQYAEEMILGVVEEAKAYLRDKGSPTVKITGKTISGPEGQASALIKEARKGGFGEIVVGRRGLSRVGELIMGRVSNKVVHLAKNEAVWIVS